MKNYEQVAEDTYDNYSILDSEIDSLYREFDKLAKKSGGRLSDLALANVNLVIKDSKELLTGDRYVDRVSEFVAAGENPLNSDVLLILATLRTALGRFYSIWSPIWDDLGID